MTSHVDIEFTIESELLQIGNACILEVAEHSGVGEMAAVADIGSPHQVRKRETPSTFCS